jgi:hypothetical protein
MGSMALMDYDMTEVPYGNRYSLNPPNWQQPPTRHDMTHLYQGFSGAPDGVSDAPESTSLKRDSDILSCDRAGMGFIKTRDSKTQAGQDAILWPEAVFESKYTAKVTPSNDSSSGELYEPDYGLSLGPQHDLDPNFTSSRERMGACSSGFNSKKVGVNVMGSDVAGLGTRNDDIFDGERAVAISTQPCTQNASTSSLKLLYHDTMGLTNPPPYVHTCEFLGPQGYAWKGTC